MLKVNLSQFVNVVYMVPWNTEGEVHIDCIVCLSAWFHSSVCVWVGYADVENVKQFLLKQKCLKSFTLTVNSLTQPIKV